MSKNHTIEVSHDTYNLLEEVKKVFVSYTWEDIKEFSDDKVIEILASGFFDVEEDDGEDDEGDDDGEDKKGSCCGGKGDCSCKNKDKKEKDWCGCGHQH